MKCRDCGTEMKLLCSSNRSGRGGYSSATLYQCPKCGETCRHEGLYCYWGSDLYGKQIKELKERLAKREEK